MNIEWVNHASFVVEQGSVRLICDPWIEGAVFNESWKHLSSTVFGYDDFARITHIFFSHEHPDHFFPPNIKKIPLALRSDITVLFHETKDKRVIRLCRSLGFKTLELPEKRWLELAPGFEVLCGSQHLMDSWLIIRGSKTLVNFNDCLTHLDDLDTIAALAPSPDVLLTQFSYASWVGNPDDADSHRLEARTKYGQMQKQIAVLRPQTVIPCASFVWFSHEENVYMNAAANRVDDVSAFIDKFSRSIVLYPGDRWIVGEDHSNQKALECYAVDYASVPARALQTAPRVPLDGLLVSQEAFFRKAFHRNNRWLLYALPSATAMLEDLGIGVRLSFRHPLRVTTECPDIILSSDSLNYCLCFDWGSDTLGINGRYRIPQGARPHRFFNHFRPAAYNAAGHEFNFVLASRLVAKKLVHQMRHPDPR